jgi:hypothetical protein
MIFIKRVKTVFAILLLAVLAAEIYAETPQQAWNEERVLWFKKPAKEWKFALPVGNGRLGAMVLGTYPQRPAGRNGIRDLPPRAYSVKRR